MVRCTNRLVYFTNRLVFCRPYGPRNEQRRKEGTLKPVWHLGDMHPGEFRAAYNDPGWYQRNKDTSEDEDDGEATSRVPGAAAAALEAAAKEGAAKEADADDDADADADDAGADAEGAPKGAAADGEAKADGEAGVGAGTVVAPGLRPL